MKELHKRSKDSKNL